MKISKQDFLFYVEGWLSASESFEDLSLNNMGAALQNAFTMLKDDQDGIIAELERQKYLDSLPQISNNVSMKVTDFAVQDKVTPISPKNHAFGDVFVVEDIWPIGKGGVEGRIIAGGGSFLPSQLAKVLS